LKKILIIDDESIICSTLKMLLEDLSYEVVTAENGKEGVELYHKEDIDLIISDINMPEMNGFQLCEYISKDNPDFPIIVLSGLGAIDQAMQAIKLGAWDFLNKPIKDFSILEHSISKAFEKAELLQENRKYREFLESIV
jgi:putative two-component system response regulator